MQEAKKEMLKQAMGNTLSEGGMLAVNELGNLPVTRNVVEIIRADELDEKEVAKRAGYSERELDDMLSGNRIITAFDIMKLYTALGVDANALFKQERG